MPDRPCYNSLMHLTQKEIFWKCWLWSIISGAIVAGLFWWLTDLLGLFRGTFGGRVFLDLMLTLCIFVSDFGAGFVGWRIVDKYYHNQTRRFVRQYTIYCLVGFALLMATIFSPLSILALLWSFVAPLCVILAFRKVDIKPVKSYGPTRQRARKTR